MAIVAEIAPTNTLTFQQALDMAEVLARTALPPALHERLSCALALVKAGAVLQLDDGHTWTVASARTPGKEYRVNGACSCADAHYRAQKRCKHALAVYLARKTLELMQAPAAQEDPAPQAVPVEPAPAAPVHGIQPQYLTTIQGRPFVRFEGLLALAHERGLVALETTVVQVTSDGAVCQSTARFADGRVFTNIGDANPTNVKKPLAPHFIRMAATRASARALRRALNIDAVAVEELGEEAA